MTAGLEHRCRCHHVLVCRLLLCSFIIRHSASLWMDPVSMGLSVSCSVFTRCYILILLPGPWLPHPFTAKKISLPSEAHLQVIKAQPSAVVIVVIIKIFDLIPFKRPSSLRFSLTWVKRDSLLRVFHFTPLMSLKALLCSTEDSDSSVRLAGVWKMAPRNSSPPGWLP